MEFDEIVKAVQAAPAPLSLWELLLDLAKENDIERLSYQHYGVVPRWGENAEPRHETITASPTETLHIAAYGIPQEWVDEYVQEDIYEYFMDADTSSVDKAFLELKDDDITREEVQLMRIKFISKIAN